MTKMSTMPRLAIAGVVALIGLIALSASAFAQPVSTPHQFYGGGLEEGDVVGIGDESGTADADGNWSITSTAGVAAEADEDSFTLNGKSASATLTSQGESLTQVDIAAMSMPSMPEGEDGDELQEEGAEDELLEEDDTSMPGGEGEDVGMPSTGSGGLADSSGISAGLIGLLIALGAAAIAGLGYRRVRNRA